MDDVFKRYLFCNFKCKILILFEDDEFFFVFKWFFFLLVVVFCWFFKDNFVVGFKKMVYNMIEKWYCINFNDKILQFCDVVLVFCIVVQRMENFGVYEENGVDDMMVDEIFGGFFLVVKFNKVIILVKVIEYIM